MTLAIMPTVATVPPTLGPVDDPLYESVDGQVLELPPMSTYAGILASRLHGRLDAYVEAKKSGHAVMEILFGLNPATRLWRRPDVAFVSEARWPRHRPFPNSDPWPVVPDLAVEVVSPSDQAEALRLKIIEYFRYGVTHVWVVWPQARFVDVYESPIQVRVFTVDDTLEGGSILPGFALPLREFFREEAAANGATGSPQSP